MMCKHEFVLDYLQEAQRSISVCTECRETKAEIDLTAARAELAEEKEKNKTAKIAGQLWVTFDEHMKALKKIKQMEDAIKFDFERFMEFQRRAEQAEAQCASIADAYVKMKGDFMHHAYCKLNDSPPGDKCTCGVWEMVKAIEYADAGSAILTDPQRYREAASSSAQRETAGEGDAP